MLNCAQRMLNLGPIIIILVISLADKYAPEPVHNKIYPTNMYSTTPIVISENINTEWDTLPSLSFNPPLFSKSLEKHYSNRYPDVLALEKTRVKSSNSDDFYVNGNYIQVRNFLGIATQAPVPTEFKCFWEMILEHNVKYILMLSKLIEGFRVKADRYWPPNVNQTLDFDGIKVTLQNETKIGNIIFREILVSNKTQKLLVSHIQYTGWPDFGVPENVDEIRLLVNLVKNASCPVVHCSAGIGRSGTFLAILCYLHLLATTGEPSTVFDIVSQFRHQRMGMVQTIGQYEFIYAVLAEELNELKSSNCKYVDTDFHVQSLKLVEDDS